MLTPQIIHTLTSGTAPPMGVNWWIHDAIVDRTAIECQRISLSAGELRAEIARVMASPTRTPENTALIQGIMQRAKSLDEQAAAWVASVPEAWQHRTLCWQLHTVTGGYSTAEVYPGRVDVYSDLWVAAVWNQVRTTRLILMSISVRCAAWVCSPVDYRTTPEYATAVRVCDETISDILASVPYHLGWHAKRREMFSDLDGASFECGQEYGEKALAGYFMTWPLACIMTQDYSTDARMFGVPLFGGKSGLTVGCRTGLRQGQAQVYRRRARRQVRTHHFECEFAYRLRRG